MTEDQAAKGMALIGGTVSAATVLAPRPLLRVFGVPAAEVTGAGLFGWRLFAARTMYLSVLAWRGDEAARRAFLPVQLLDQVVFWQAFRARSFPRPGAAFAAAVSGVIIALDLRRRGAV